MKFLISSLVIGASAALIATHADAAAYQYTLIDVPGSTGTSAAAINLHDMVVGAYVSADGTQRGYTYYLGKMRTFTAPAPHQGAFTNPTAIGPTGLVAGTYGIGKVFPFYLLPKSAETQQLYYPGDSERQVTPTSISQDPFGNIAGYEKFGGKTVAFNTQNDFAEWVEIEVPGASVTTQTGYARQPGSYERPVGNYITDQQHGFTDSSTTPIDPPGSVNTYLGYLNNAGDAGGYALDASGVTFGFVRRGENFTRYDYPGAKSTTVVRNLNHGEVFGEYVDAAGLHHAYHFIGGSYRTLSPIAGASTTLAAVAVDGSFTGTVTDSNGVRHGYIATCALGQGKCVD